MREKQKEAIIQKTVSPQSEEDWQIEKTERDKELSYAKNAVLMLEQTAPGSDERVIAKRKLEYLEREREWEYNLTADTWRDNLTRQNTEKKANAYDRMQRLDHGRKTV